MTISLVLKLVLTLENPINSALCLHGFACLSVCYIKGSIRYVALHIDFCGLACGHLEEAELNACMGLGHGLLWLNPK